MGGGEGSGIKGFAFVDHVGCTATRSDISQVLRQLDTCARDTINWAEMGEPEFDIAKTEAALLTQRRGQQSTLSWS